MKSTNARRFGFYLYGLGIAVFGALTLYFGIAFYFAGTLFNNGTFDLTTAVKATPPLLISLSLLLISVWRFRQNLKITITDLGSLRHSEKE